jgi:'Cold-shock' DNA-binding domain
VFVHISAVERAGLSSLNEGQAVEYEIDAGPVGWVVGGVVGGTIGGIQGLFGVGPSYYEGPGVYPWGYPTRHSYRHVRHRYTTS